MLTNKYKLAVLEILKECLEDTHNYPPDKWYEDFKRTVENKIEELEQKEE